jgi:benzoyl-CoA reductase/2-hydroxyglutaryl-CoA dehydratase subunit BcrC/BadD/HgdB
MLPVVAAGGKVSNRQLNDIKKPIVGWFCVYTPIEIFHALNLHPYRILGGNEKIVQAGAYMGTPVCSYAKSCLDEALRGKYDFLHGVVFNNSCIIMKTLYNLWKSYLKTPFIYMLDVPHVTSPSGLDFFVYSLEQMIAEMSRHFGVKFNKEDLRPAMLIQEEIRRLQQRLFSFCSDEKPRLSYHEFHTVVEEGFYFPREQDKEKLREMVKEVSGRPPLKPGKKRILVTGAHCSNPDIIPILEEMNLQVVYDDLCTGNRYYGGREYDTDPDPVRALAKGYLNQSPCPRMKDASDKHQQLVEIVKRENISGVIFIHMKFCCTFTYDFSILKRKMDSLSIPNLLLEGDYTTGNSEQIRTRLQVFSEILASMKRT